MSLPDRWWAHASHERKLRLARADSLRVAVARARRRIFLAQLSKGFLAGLVALAGIWIVAWLTTSAIRSASRSRHTPWLDR